MKPHVVEDTGDLLVARKVRMEFGGLIALDDIDFTVPRGSITSLIGPNGAGKTTFFNMLTGVYTPTSGEIVFDGHEVRSGEPPHKITQFFGIGRTFQNIRLFPTMSAVENVLVGMYCRTHLRDRPAAILRHSRVSAGRSATRTPRRPSSSSYCGLPSGMEQEGTRATSATATSGGSRSRGRWPPTRSSCCSTSRRPV